MTISRSDWRLQAFYILFKQSFYSGQLAIQGGGAKLKPLLAALEGVQELADLVSRGLQEPAREVS